jgi:hypothetical protein
VNDAFSSAINALLGDLNMSDDALWNLCASSLSQRTVWRTLGNTDLLPTVSIDIRHWQTATITETRLIVIGTEMFKIIREPMGDELSLLLVYVLAAI